mmetsp:Transcript_70097/g.222179  ORF Transcript_70097/g.222179 Transcript_70097/m.222179 type:complete len:409 (-) Transcript_70097:176-1402(-)|eukprot:CAMPEP_0182897324 /NCGR_PEP_ID=MMETSP0034_2-20130328/26810_1 /TAXON_ID=156128 /ORGANISM="Nephroselmis pyriformis, Strain CCMP717" /LENGTH=408 /DNA_ID=CAMNT_0025031237 /DNA_START=257 /DNA_END=1483 /DNA_ORIENTATION=-
MESKKVDKTLALIKPDAVKAGNAGSIKQLIEANGFTIVSECYTTLSTQRAMEFYGEHNGKNFFEGLVEFMTSGPIYALVLAKDNAVTEWRNVMGPTNSDIARDQAPESIRALFGTDGRFNASHGSDSPISAAREIKFFFPKMVLEPIPDPEQAKEYIKGNLEPTLIRGLTALCKNKPSADKYEAISWLANWLLDNNPNKPSSYGHMELPLNPEDEDNEEAFQAALLGLGEEEEAVAEVGEDTNVEALLEDKELEMAATRVQSHFRGYQTRKEVEDQRKKAQAAPVVVVESHADELMSDDQAAVRVQATYRGHAARKHMKDKKAAAKVDEAAAETPAGEELPDLDDPDMEAAAIKIQAHQKGRKTRKEMAAKKASKPAGEEAAPAEPAPAEEAAPAEPAAEEAPAPAQD